MNEPGEVFFVSGFILSAISFSTTVCLVYFETKSGRENPYTRFGLGLVRIGVLIMLAGFGINILSGLPPVSI